MSANDDVQIIEDCISQFSSRNQSVPWVTDAWAALERIQRRHETIVERLEKVRDGVELVPEDEFGLWASGVLLLAERAAEGES